MNAQNQNLFSKSARANANSMQHVIDEGLKILDDYAGEINNLKKEGIELKIKHLTELRSIEKLLNHARADWHKLSKLFESTKMPALTGIFDKLDKGLQAFSIHSSHIRINSDQYHSENKEFAMQLHNLWADIKNSIHQSYQGTIDQVNSLQALEPADLSSDVSSHKRLSLYQARDLRVQHSSHENQRRPNRPATHQQSKL